MSTNPTPFTVDQKSLPDRLLKSIRIVTNELTITSDAASFPNVKEIIEKEVYYCNFIRTFINILLKCVIFGYICKDHNSFKKRYMGLLDREKINREG